MDIIYVGVTDSRNLVSEAFDVALETTAFLSHSARALMVRKPQRDRSKARGLASAARIDSRVRDRSVHRAEILPIDVARSGRRQTGQVVC